MIKNHSILIISILLCIALTSCNDQEPEPSQSPNGRTEWRSMMRNYDASPEKILAAREAIRSQFSKERDANNKDGGLNKWEVLASNSGAGRTRAIAVHPTDPTILYLGGANGGVWKTNNGGNTWRALDDFLPSLAVTSIIIHPTNPDTIYIATGESIVAGTDAQSTPGAGIFQSVDGGNKWELIEAIDPNDIDDFLWINKIAFDPSDPSSFYATSNGSTVSATGSNRLFRFDDHGATKTELTGFGDVSFATSVTNVVVNPGDPSHIMVCTSGGLVQSYDQGSTWIVASPINTPGWLTPSNRVEVAVAPSNPDFVYALCQGDTNSAPDGANLLFSANKGISWLVMQSGISVLGGQGWYNNVIWVDPLDDTNILFGGIDLFRSTNSGISFEKISDWTQNNVGLSLHADQHVIVAASDYSSANKRVYFGNDGGIASTANWTTVTETSGWELLNSEQLGITQYYESDIYDGVIIAGSQDNGSWVSQDDGASFYRTIGGDGGGCTVSRQDPNLIFTSFQFGKIQAPNVFWASTIDSIVSLNIIDLVNSEPSGSSPFIVQMEAFPNEGNKVLIGSYSLWEFEVDPMTYDSVALIDRSPMPASVSNPITAIDISTNGDTVVVGYADGEIWLGTVQSPNWVWSQRVDYNRPITSVDIAPYNKSRIAATLGGYIDDNIRISEDAGLSWTEMSNGIPALQVNVVKWHPDATRFVYAGTDLGIFSSDDGARNWNITPNYNGISDGPAFTEVTELQFSRGVTSADFHFMYATTFGRGIWKTENIVRANTFIDQNYTSTPQLGSINRPFQFIEQAENVQAHGQIWYFDTTIDSAFTRNYPVPAGGVLIDKRIGVIRKFQGKNGGVIIGN